jgi:hypothetical protein
MPFPADALDSFRASEYKSRGSGLHAEAFDARSHIVPFNEKPLASAFAEVHMAMYAVTAIKALVRVLNIRPPYPAGNWARDWLITGFFFFFTSNNVILLSICLLAFSIFGRTNHA